MRGNQAQKNNRRKRRKLKPKKVYITGRSGQVLVQREDSALFTNTQFLGCTVNEVKGKI